MSAPVPVMQERERRMASPHPAFARAKLEPIHQPLYSAHNFDNAAIPLENRFFNYGIGQNVSGAGAGVVASTLLHTNMEQAGFLAMPKLFLVTGLRVVFANLDSALTTVLDGSDDPGSAPSPELDDMVRILYGTATVFHVGTKDYVVCPTFNVPANCGGGGIAATGIVTVAEEARNLINFQPSGRYYSLPTYPTLIPSQQAFYVDLRATQAGPPTLAAERIVWFVLDGIFGRETQ